MRHSGGSGDGFGGGATGPGDGAVPGDDDVPGDTGGVPGDAALIHLETIRTAIAGLSEVTWWARSDEATREGVCLGYQVLGSLEACLLPQLADLDSRPGALPLARPDTIGRTFLRHRLRHTPSQAAATMRAALALTESNPTTGGMPSLAAVFAAGLTSRAHIDVAVRFISKLPKKLLSLPLPRLPQTDLATATDAAADVADTDAGADGVILAGEALDAFFAHYSQALDSHALQILAKHILTQINPDDADGFNPSAVDKRRLNHSSDSTGMIVGNFALDPAAGATVVAALDHFSAPNPTVTLTAEDGTQIEVRDNRDLSQRQADALVLIATLAMGSTEAGNAKAGEPPRVTIHVGVQDILDAYATNGSPNETDTDLYAHTGTNAHDDADSEGACDGSGSGETAAPAETVVSNPAGETVTGDHAAATATGNEDGADIETSSSKKATGTAFRRPNPAHTGPAGSGVKPGCHGAECQELGPIGTRLLARFLCDAVLQKVLFSAHGAVLDLGRQARTASPAQRRALVARDRGCTIPGCSAPPEWCDAHHVTHWSRGGLTNIDNMALVCARHHTDIHLGIWDMIMIDGLPWVRPPSWMDSARRLIRNRLPESANQARSLGTQLRLSLENPTPATPPARPAPSGRSTPEQSEPRQATPPPEAPPATEDEPP